MKLIKAFIHHVRAASVVDALADAGYRNLTLHDVKGMLKPITGNERAYSVEAGGLVIAEVQLSLVVEDNQMSKVTSIIQTVGRIGQNISGYIYVSTIDQVLQIGGAAEITS